MILVDTSVWVDHFRSGNAALTLLLEEETVLTHRFIVGELSLGSLKDRSQVLSNLDALRFASVAQHHEVLRLVEAHRLLSKGLGWIDVHLLASALLTKCNFWSLDRRLATAARMVGLKPGI